MTAAAKNIAIVYAAPSESTKPCDVRIVDYQYCALFRPTPVEYVIYEGNETALIDAGLVPAAMFGAVPKSGKKSARFEHPDGRLERVTLASRARGLWRVRRQYHLL